MVAIYFEQENHDAEIYFSFSFPFFFLLSICLSNVMYKGVVGWCEGAVYLTSLGHPTDIGLQLDKTCYPCSG